MAYDTDAQAFIDAVESEDGAPLPVGIANAIDALFVGMKATPSLNVTTSNFDECKGLSLFAGPATLDGSLVPAIGPSPVNHGFADADHSQRYGLTKSVNTQYIDTGRLDDPSMQNNYHQLVWLSAVPTVNTALGGSSGEGNALYYRASPPGIGIRSRAGLLIYSDASGLPGLYGQSRYQSASYVAYTGDGSAVVTRSSTSPGTDPLYVLKYGTSDSAGVFTIGAQSTGGAVDGDAMRGLLTEYMNAVAAEFNPISHSRVVQRSGSHGDLAVSGNYSDSGIETVEVQITESPGGSVVVSWVDVEAVLLDGKWAGSVSVPVGGPYLAAVRFKDALGDVISGEAEGDSTFLVGDVFVAIGQSNTMGAGSSYQSHDGEAPAWIIKRVGEVEETLADPWVVKDRGGSWGPILGSLIEASQSVPLVFITTADSSLGLSSPKPDFLPPSGAWWQQVDLLVESVGVNGISGVLWLQGERDSLSGVSKATYEANEKLLASSVASWPGSPPLIVTLHGYNTDSAAGLDAIRAAKIANWDDASTIAGANTIDIDLSDEGGDGLHFKTNAELTTVAARIWFSLEDLLYGGSNGRGPRLVSAIYGGSTVVLAFDRDLDPSDTEYTASAFSVGNAGGDAVSVVSAARTGAREVTLVCSGVIDSESPTVSFGSQNSAGGAVVPKTAPIALPKTIHSISAVALPAEPFYSQSIELALPDPPVLTTITVSPATATVTAGGTQQFTAKQLDQYGEPIDAGDVEWSADSGTIDESGLYTAPATAGSATITAAVGEISGTATVTVSAPGTGDLSDETIAKIAAAVLNAAAANPIAADVRRVNGESQSVATEESVRAVMGAVEAAKDYPEASDVRDGVEYANGIYVGVLDVGTGLPTPEYPPGSAGL